MSIPGAASPLFIGAAAADAAAFQIDRSIRLNSGDSAYLNRTPSSAGNRKTWTWSGWVKLCKNKGQVLFHSYSAQNDTGAFFIDYTSGGSLRVLGWSTVWRTTSAIFRDFSAWQHVVVAVDTTSATANDRIKVYVNGSQITDFSALNNPSQSADLAINQAATHRIGNYTDGSNNYDYLDGYLTEVNFVDGQALAATDFGELDSNSIWQPKNVSVSSINDGTVWSNGWDSTYINSSFPGTNSFDGSTSTKTLSNNNSTATWTPSSGISIGTSLRVYGRRETSGGTLTFNFSDSTTGTITISATTTWYEVSGAAGKTLTSVVIGKDSSGYEGVFHALEIDGEILVDSYNNSTGYGTNGFYLKFADNSSNAALGKNSAVADDFTSTVGALTTTQAANFYAAGSYPANNLFDGSTSTIVYGGYNSTSTNSDLIWTPNGAYTVSSSLRVYAGYYSTIYVNDVSKATGGQSSAQGWVTLSHTGSITSIKFENTSNANIVRAAAIEVDGTVVETTAWTVNNLTAAGSAWNQSQTWSSGLSALSGSLTNPPNGFDGDVDSYADSTAGFSLDLSSHTFGTGSHSIEVKSGGATSFSVNGSTSLSDPGGGGAKVWTGTHTGEITSIASSATGASVYYVKIDNLFLVNAGVVDTAASGIDSLIDTPTNYTAGSGNNGGNYCTLNPLAKGGDITLSQGNLHFSSSTANGFRTVLGTIGMSSGKWYCEVESTNSSSVGLILGIALGSMNLNTWLGGTSDSWGYYEGQYKYHNSSGSSYGASFGVGDTIGIAFDADNGTLAFYKNGSSQGNAYTGLSSDTYFFAVSDGGTTTASATINFGQRPFAYTPPTGYVSLCTQNLPDPTIADGSTAFDAVLYSGTGSSQTVGSLNFSPDLAWMKQRSGSRDHMIHDTVRGDNKGLYPSQNYAEATVNGVTFGSTGFTLSTDSHINQSSNTYVAWAWDAGTSTVSNTDGSITTNVRANASAGFSIISYTGNNTSGATIGHGLNAAPEFAIFKQRGVANDWSVYHKAAGATGYLRLNLADAFGTTSGQFNDTHPSASVITLGSDHNANGPSNPIICYAWAPVAGYSAFGTYLGNLNANGSFAFCGFAPALVVVKASSSTGAWYVYDRARGPINPNDNEIYWNLNAKEYTINRDIDFLSNGFKIRTNDNGFNASGVTYIWMAWAESPFKTARAR